MRNTVINRPILGFAAYSGTGKTTLLKKLLPILTQDYQLKIAMIKHAHHKFDIDTPGKDSYELRHAGASQMLVASSQRWALMVEQAQATDPDLFELVSKLDHNNTDLILVEGFKLADIPKIELYRASLPHSFLYPEDSNIIAVASDSDLILPRRLTRLNLNQPEQIAKFIVEWQQTVGKNND